MIAGLPFNVFIFQASLLGISIIFAIILRKIRGSSIGKLNLLVAFCAFFQFSHSITTDTYYFYGPKIERDAKFAPVESGDFLGIIRRQAAEFYYWCGNNFDSRVFQDEHQPLVRTCVGYCHGVIGSALAFLAWTGHLTKNRCVFITQTIFGVWYFTSAFCFLMPEYINGFKNINVIPTAIAFLPTLLFFLASVIGAYCGLCSCSENVCCFIPPKPEDSQKKKQ